MKPNTQSKLAVGDSDMKKLISLIVLIIILSLIPLNAQKHEHPKLIVGIVVDQMRFTDLYRYYDYYGVEGFKRLIRDGGNFTNAHYNYVPTNTGPGHASIYTGTTPYFHGIVNNDFYDRELKKTIYCVADENQSTVGDDGDEGKCSPKNLLSTTITDELKMFFNKKSKVISISIKDRGSILPGGHFPNGAYWYNFQSGKFITSTYYMNSLPEWVKNFNEKRLPDQFLKKEWSLFIDKKFYEINNPDDSPFEPDFFNEGKNTFPHNFDKLKPEDRYNKLAFTPFMNEILLEFIKTAIVSESLGKDSVPDFLAISFSTPDLLGHVYGNYSYELMDLYLRLDRQIADLLKFLDNEIGEKNYLLFLTADHASIETPGYLRKNNLPTGELIGKIQDSLKTYIKNKYGNEKLLEFYSSGMIYLNYNLIDSMKLNSSELERDLAFYLRQTFPEIQQISRRSHLENQVAYRENPDLISNGWHPAKSADIIFTLRPGYLFKFLEKGTTHGSRYNYDTHVPLIFYGWNVSPGTINQKVFIVDIAPTISSLLKISLPSAAIGKPLF